MKRKIPITDFWREKMRHFRALPPDDAWKSIEFRLDLDEVWTRIENRLDIEEVWGKLEPALESEPKKRILPIYYLLAASLALLIGMFLFLPGKKQTRQTAEQSVIKTLPDYQQVMKVPERNIETSGTEASEQALQKATIRQISTAPVDLSPESTASERNESTIHQLAEVPAVSSSVPAPLTTRFTCLPVSDILPAEMSRTAETPDPREDTEKHQPWKAGISTHINNHWLLNETTYGGFASDNLTTSLPEVGVSFQVTLSRDIHPRWGLRVESEWLDQGGQSYRRYIHGHYLKKSIHLQYFTLQTLLLKHQPGTNTVLPGRGSLLMGLYGSFLYEAREEVERYPATDLHSVYRNFDCGIILGYEHPFNLSQKVELNPGIRIHYGIPNVFRGNDIIPGYLLRTNRASFRFQLGFSYRF
ncbi:MAG: outer membrane beta-barrel protein [Bacteroidales bacterium]